MQITPPSPPPLPQLSQSESSDKTYPTFQVARRTFGAPTAREGFSTGAAIQSVRERESHFKEVPFHKTHYFFYGTLRYSDRVSYVLEKDVSQSLLLPAHIVGYTPEPWGQYQALVKGSEDAVVEGVAYEVQTEEDARKLARYETNAYELVPCTIYLESELSPKEPKQISGLTFVYAGDPQALKEDRWDNTLWMKNVATMIRKLEH